MKHNIFISYAWVDNEVYPGADKGWVSTFVEGLRKQLARELGRRDEAECLWLDYEQMRGNEGLTPTIRAHLEASRTLVLVLSNGYLASAWCREELAAFAAQHGPASGRIFVVHMSPVDQEPTELRDLLKYQFWYLDDERQPCTRWFPLIDPTDREYSSEQQSLARDLAAKLRALGQSSAEPVPAQVQINPATAPETRRVQPVASADKPQAEAQPGVAERNVLISGGAEDRDLIYAIAKRLVQKNLGVALPLSVLADQSGYKSSELTDDFRDNLAVCSAVLIVYRHGPLQQIRQHLIECLKVSAKVSRSKTPPTIDLCQTASDSLALGLYPKGMRIHVVGEACADDCVTQFLDGLTA